LEQYGYLPQQLYKADTSSANRDMTSAIVKFQQMAGITLTGEYSNEIRSTRFAARLQNESYTVMTVSYIE
jgi:hypothetical protein